MLVDTHAHLEAVNDLGAALNRAKENGVTKIITIGTSIATSKKAIEIANPPSREASEGQENIPQIYATVGIHPQDGKSEVRRLGLYQCINTLKQILNRVQDDGIVVAVGECGLDFYSEGEKRLPTVDKDRSFQRKLFEEQLKLAQELKLPLIIHCRNAWDEIFEIIEGGKLKVENLRGVFHSWTGDWQAAKKALNLGFYISFSGIITFKNAQDIQEVAKKAPLDRILIETDSPFLAPEPLRAERNEPKNVKIIGKFLAEIRKESLDLISSVTTANAVKLFKL